MDIFQLQCIEIEHNEGYDLVVLQFSSTEPTIYTSGNLNFTIFDGSRFEIGKFYNLNLEEVPV
jgi:hypothetical protein